MTFAAIGALRVKGDFCAYGMSTKISCVAPYNLPGE